MKPAAARPDFAATNKLAVNKEKKNVGGGQNVYIKRRKMVDQSKENRTEHRILDLWPAAASSFKGPPCP